MAYESAGQDPGGDAGIYLRQYTAAGVAEGAESRVPTAFSGTQAAPSVATIGTKAVVVWSGNGPGDGDGVFGQRLGGPGVTVSPTSGLTTTEAGGPATFSIVLASRPTAVVVLPIASSDTTEGVVSSSSATFTPYDWDTPRAVTLIGVDDILADGDVGFTILLGPATSADPRYSGLDPADVAATNADNEPALRTRAYKQGVDNGFGVYSGTVDTQLRQNAPGTDDSASTTLMVDWPNASDESQALIRFDDIIGAADLAVFHPEFDLDGDGTPDAGAWTIRYSSTGRVETIPFGAPCVLDRPAPADYDGDGIDDIAAFRSVSDLAPGSAQWFILPSADGRGFAVTFGQAGTIAAPADYDGDGRLDLAVFDAGSGAWTLRRGIDGPERVVTSDGSGGVSVTAPLYFRLRSACGTARQVAGTGSPRVASRFGGSTLALAAFDAPDVAPEGRRGLLGEPVGPDLWATLVDHVLAEDQDDGTDVP